MATNALTSFAQSWNKRASEAQGAGISMDALRPIFQMDLQRLQSGSTPLTNEQAGVALLSAQKQGPVLEKKPKGVDLNPLHLIGNAAKDIGEIGKGLITLPKAIAHDVSHIGEMPGALAKAAGDIGKGDIGHGLQEIAAAPGLQELLIAGDFIPGVDVVTAPLIAGVLGGAVAGKAMTPEGRTDLTTHPLINALNVLPGLSELGLTKMASEAVQKTAAFSSASKVMDDLGVSARYRDVWRTFSDARKQAHDKVSGFFDQANELFSNHPPEHMAEITKALKSGSPEAIAQAEVKFPGFKEVKARYDSLQEQLSADPEHFVHLAHPDSGVTDVYPIGSLPDQTFRTLTRRKDELATATESLKTNQARVGELRTKATEAQAAVPDPAKIAERLQPAMKEEINLAGLGNARIAPALDALRQGNYGAAARMLREGGQGEAAAEVSSIRAAQRNALRARSELQRAEQRGLSASKAVVENRTRVQRQEQAFRKALDRKPAARWHPNVTDEFHNKVEAWAQDFYSKDPKRLEKVVSEINDRYYGGTFEDGTPIFPPKALRQIEKDSVAKITEWQKAGWNPSFVHTTTESQLRNLRYPQVARRAEPRISSFREKLLSQGEGDVQNVAISLTHQQAEIAVNELWNNAWKGYVGPDGIPVKGVLEQFGKSRSQVVDELRARGLSTADAQAEVAREWESPSRFASVNAGPFAKDSTLIPRSLAKNIDRLTPSLSQGGPSHLKAAFDKATRGYRFAVTGLSPQHVVHVIASGGVMFGMAMTDLPNVIRSVGEARQMIKEGRVPVRFRQEASQLPEEDAMLFGARDRSAARLYSETIGKGLHPLQRVNAAMNHFDEHVTQWYKTLDYVSQTKKGLDPEQALHEVGKHFADHAGRSPMERAIFKSYVPFGSWTQHLLRYTFNFPADHPIRAAILANLATAELEDQTSGLPRNFAQLFFLGNKAFDIRSFNPFRDIGNDFKLSGFIASLNPAAEALFRSKGYDPVSDTAELYPELTVDPNTGKLVTKGKNTLQVFGESVLPQVQGVEALLGWSDSMRNLKKSNPSAYTSTLARYLHFPWLPRTMDMNQERAKEQLNQLRVAQQDVSSAVKSGKWGQADQFNLVPFQGRMVNPQQLQALLGKLQAQSPGTPVKDLIPKR